MFGVESRTILMFKPNIGVVAKILVPETNSNKKILKL
jgi:hypothetical protein